MVVNYLVFAGFVVMSVAMDSKLRTFPEDFQFGLATSSYQIEGAWNEDGKGENIWDMYTHTNPNKIVDKTNGDVACDSYHKYKEDVQMIKSLGGQVYRFSLSWSRILPTGFSYKVNQKGIDYYNNLINELLANGIEPMVTLFHWDLPQPLQNLGGFTNREIINYFKDYADVAFKAFGDRVKLWITFNEPLEFCHGAYGGKFFAPGFGMSGVADYLAGENLLIAHALAHQLYHQKYEIEGGKVGIAISANWIEPWSTSEADVTAADDAMQFNVGWFASPLFTNTGDYPEVMKKKIQEHSRAQGFPRSRLGTVDSLQELARTYGVNLTGSSDFFGLNHYTTVLMKATSGAGTEPSFDEDRGGAMESDPAWTTAGPRWLNSVPWGLRKALNWVRRQYNNPLVYITENGCGDYNGQEDTIRIAHYHSYLEQLLQAVKEDGCNITMYLAWSLMDNFEWGSGYTEKFGIFEVDFSDPERKRTPKKSAKYLKQVMKTKTLPEKVEHVSYNDEL